MKSKKHQPGHFNQAGVVPSWCLCSDIACSGFVYFCIPKFSCLGSQLQFDRLCASVWLCQWGERKCRDAYPWMTALKHVLDLTGRFLFRSGNQEHPGDKIENTTVEILPVSVWKHPHTQDSCARLPPFSGAVCEWLWLDYIEWLLWGTWGIDYWQECECDRIAYSSRGDSFWHCAPCFENCCQHVFECSSNRRHH